MKPSEQVLSTAIKREMEEGPFADYVFEELSVQIDFLKRSSTFHVAGHRISTPRESGIHKYNATYRRIPSLPSTPVPSNQNSPQLAHKDTESRRTKSKFEKNLKG